MEIRKEPADQDSPSYWGTTEPSNIHSIALIHWRIKKPDEVVMRWFGTNHSNVNPVLLIVLSILTYRLNMEPMDLNSLVNQGAAVHEPVDSLQSLPADLTFLALRTALHSFFELSQAFPRRDLYRLTDGLNTFKNEQYIEIYYRTIIHLQHFFELSIKEILRSVDTILPLDRNGAAVLVEFLKMRNGKEFNPEQLEKAKTVEFSEALQRFSAVVKAGVLALNPAQEALAHKDFFHKLNNLRNRIWHRGTYILHFDAFVRFIGEYAFPAIKPVLAALGRAGSDRDWKYKPLHSSVDPMDLLTKLFQRQPFGSTDLWEVFSILELGRAAYQNPMPEKRAQNSAWYDYQCKRNKRYEEIAQDWAAHNHSIELAICPVCGLQALTVDVDIEGYVGSNGEDEWVVNHFEVFCHCCSYKLPTFDMDPAKYGYCPRFMPQL